MNLKSFESEFNADQIIESLQKIAQNAAVATSDLHELNQKIRTAQHQFSIACEKVIKSNVLKSVHQAIKILKICPPPHL